MDLLEAIKTRRSVRRFISTPIKSETIEAILEAGTKAPSAGNCQPWEFVIIRSAANKQALAAAAFGQDFVAEAPIVIVVCANTTRSMARYGHRGQELYCIQDTAAAIENILLAAHSLGLGACWVGAFDENMVAKQVRTPSDVRPVAIIPIGKAAATATSSVNRIQVEEVIHYDAFDT